MFAPLALVTGLLGASTAVDGASGIVLIAGVALLVGGVALAAVRTIAVAQAANAPISARAAVERRIDAPPRSVVSDPEAPGKPRSRAPGSALAATVRTVA
ncbi:DUF6412 domain-containing protein [Agromyces atrinae]|uniref:DUF6412 domain-containing protein n=1 Tax=Agromyces atrinae TaxID=592376 RepID=UPI001F59A56D|nr:DUF6412 domain-containing protein [Agromyces atrinae]MCI2956640.1 DUF6412 domain-containing protein [Agromyces atrinae]